MFKTLSRMEPELSVLSKFRMVPNCETTSLIAKGVSQIAKNSLYT